jgi:hypothetical protein
MTNGVLLVVTKTDFANTDELLPVDGLLEHIQTNFSSTNNLVVVDNGSAAANYYRGQLHAITRAKGSKPAIINQDTFTAFGTASQLVSLSLGFNDTSAVVIASPTQAGIIQSSLGLFGLASDFTENTAYYFSASPQQDNTRPDAYVLTAVYDIKRPIQDAVIFKERYF